MYSEQNGARHEIHKNTLVMHVAFHSSRGYCTLMVLTSKGPGLFQLLLRLVIKSGYSTTLKKQMFLLKMKSHFHHHKAFKSWSHMKHSRNFSSHSLPLFCPYENVVKRICPCPGLVILYVVTGIQNHQNFFILFLW